MLSVAGQLGAIGAVAAGVAAWASLADRRRVRRSDPDAVGFMPWTTVSFLTFFFGVVLLALAAKGWIAG